MHHVNRVIVVQGRENSLRRVLANAKLTPNSKSAAILSQSQSENKSIEYGNVFYIAEIHTSYFEARIRKVRACRKCTSGLKVH